MVTTMVRSDATLAVDISEAAARIGITAGDFMANYGRTLRTLIDGTRFPELSAAFDSGFFELPDDQEAEFGFALERALDGIDILIRRRAGD
jgi:hypothetical protein